MDNIKSVEELAAELWEIGKQIAPLEKRLKELTLVMAERLKNLEKTCANAPETPPCNSTFPVL